jgi:hypothetical protein
MARALELAARLRVASDDLIALVESIPASRWSLVSKAGVWSPGKDAEHVADGNAYHQWIVRSSVRATRSPRPPVERKQMTAARTQREVIDLLRQRVDESLELIGGLSDAQLALPPRPARAAMPTLTEVIERVLIGHVRAHHADIQAKLRLPAAH